MNKNEQRTTVGVIVAAVQEKFPDFLAIKRDGEPILDNGVWMIDVEVTGEKSFCIQYQWTKDKPYGISDNFEEEFLCFETGNDKTFSTLNQMLDYMSERLKITAA